MLEQNYLSFSFAIEQIAKDLQKLKNERMVQFGLRAVHVTCLVKLGTAEQGLTGTELAECCGIDKSLVSRIVGDLEDGGYVGYENGERKYRRKIFLTHSGHSLLNEIYRMIDEAVSAVRFGVSDQEMETFYRVLSTFDWNIHKILEFPVALGSEARNHQKTEK